MTTPEAGYDHIGGCPVHPESAVVPLSGPRFHTDPHRLYEEMRSAHGPVVAVELAGGIPAWLVIGYRELHQVTSDPDLFPRNVALWNQWPNIPPDWPLLPMVGQPIPSIYFTAGAEHRRHVAMVEPALESIDPFELRSTCEDLADRMIDGEDKVIPPWETLLRAAAAVVEGSANARSALACIQRGGGRRRDGHGRSKEGDEAGELHGA